MPTRFLLALDVRSRRVTLMSLAADHLVANIVHESSLYRNLRLQRPGEQGREEGELGAEEGQMLTNEDLSMRYGSLPRDVSVSGGHVWRHVGCCCSCSGVVVAVLDNPCCCCCCVGVVVGWWGKGVVAAAAAAAAAAAVLLMCVFALVCWLPQ